MQRTRSAWMDDAERVTSQMTVADDVKISRPRGLGTASVPCAHAAARAGFVRKASQRAHLTASLDLDGHRRWWPSSTFRPD